MQTARNEQTHARIYLEELDGIGTTAENLVIAVESEIHESNDLYERFAKEAEEEGFTRLAASFREIDEIDKAHSEGFQRLLEEMKSKPKPKKLEDAM